MNKAALIASIAATALAGFDCDIAETDDGGIGDSGYYCGSQGKSRVENDQISYCKCKKHDKCKRESQMTCSPTVDEAGNMKTCVVGSRNSGSFFNKNYPGAHCQRPLDPDKSICASDEGLPSTGVSGYNKTDIVNTCVELKDSNKPNPYRLWKSAYDDTEYLKKQFGFLASDVEWWNFNYLFQVANTTDGGFDNITSMTDGDAGGKAMLEAWGAGAKAAATEYSCYRAYPACKRTGSSGSYIHAPDIEECETECKQINPFVTAVYDKCKLALEGKGKTGDRFQNTSITECKKYSMLWPDNVGADDERDCTLLCSMSGASSMGASLATIAALFAWSM